MTTERVLPAPLIGRPVLGRLADPIDVTSARRGPAVVVPQVPLGHPVGVVAGRKPIRTANARRAALLDTPARAGMLIGVSAAVYAVSLASVAGLQFQTQTATAQAQAPMVAALERTRAANDALEATLLAADARASTLEAEYASIGTDAASFQQRLGELASLVADVKGSAATLPTAIRLPTVKSHGAVSGSTRAPSTAGSTSASGKP
jgi:hypothetical protein